MYGGYMMENQKPLESGVVKKGCGYRVDYLATEDVLRVHVAGEPEPDAWLSLCGGVEVGVVEMPHADRVRFTGDETEPGPLTRVSVRMLSASKRPELSVLSAMELAPRVGMTRLNMLRQGHTELLGKLEERPYSVLEAMDRLADAVRGGLFGPSRDIERRTREAGFEAPREWIEDRLEDFDRARRLG